MFYLNMGVMEGVMEGDMDEDMDEDMEVILSHSKASFMLKNFRVGAWVGWWPIRL